MLVLKRSLKLLILAAMAVSASISSAEHYHPFAESLDFNPDWQIFAPVDVEELEELHPRKRAHRGWYVTYDRMSIGLDRPDFQGQSSQIDMTWGNRWDFGFMGEKNKGWLFSYMSVDGPNVYNDRRDQRLLQPATAVERFPALRPRFPFDPNFGDGTILVRNSLNVASITNVEFNKTWRLSPYHYGGILEPMIGFRYFGFNDYAVNENHEYFSTAIVATAFNAERFQTQITRTDNRMMLGQVGYRYVQPVQRMTFSHDGRFFAGQNFQTQQYSNYVFALAQAGGVIGFDLPYEQLSTFAGRDNSEFVIGMDLRFEAAYQVTKAFNIRAGSQLIYVGRGVWRGANPGVGPQNANDQAIVSPAFTFGATFNR